jgi:protein TonB
MFEDSILESSPRWRTRRGWTTLASSALQVTALALLILVPVLRPDALPLHVGGLVDRLPAPYRPVSQAGGAVHSGSHGRTSNTPSLFVQPIHIPHGIAPGPDPRTFASGSDVGSDTGPGPACPTCPVTGLPDMNVGPPPVAPHTVPPPPRPVSGGVMEGYLVKQVQPVYPRMAQIAGVQGDVILQAMIDREGRIEQLQAVSGHPMLVPAALDAVGQWRYRPYRLNGEPVEVETQITVRFILSGR